MNFKFLTDKDENLLKEGEQTDNFKNNLRNNVNELAKKKDTNFLKEFLRLRIPILSKKFLDYQNSDENKIKLENMCDYDTLYSLIKSFNVPLKYTNKDVLSSVYEEFKSKESHMFDYKRFLDHIVNFKDNNDFFNFKEKFIEGLEDKMNNDKKYLKELEINNRNLINAEDKLNKQKEDVLNDQIEKKAKEKLEPLTAYDIKYIRNPQPNKEFMLQTFSNREEYRSKIDLLKRTLDPSEFLNKRKKLF